MTEAIEYQYYEARPPGDLHTGSTLRSYPVLRNEKGRVIQDVTAYYQRRHGIGSTREQTAGVLRAEAMHGEGMKPAVFVLHRMSGWIQSIDGTTTKHSLTYYWLSEHDLACVQGQDSIVTALPDPTQLLFDQYRLWC